jgi:hypothetical protein
MIQNWSREGLFAFSGQQEVHEKAVVEDTYHQHAEERASLDQICALLSYPTAA